MLKNKNKGITLVALVVTIVVLLILAGISISALTNTGIFQKAKDAKQKSANAELDQNTKLDSYEEEISNYLPQDVKQAIKKGKPLSTDKNTEIVDEKGNKIVIPAGFKVTGDATTVDKGIVIEDATVDKDGKPTATAGSQFVWVPVGKITKEDGTKTEIKLNRYTFASDGTPTEKNNEVINSYFSETESKGNTVAKNIVNFTNSVKANGGYYIGRYEARTTTARTASGNALTQITEKGTDQVYNYVTQKQAAEQAQGMYTSNNFTSDLMNSYAWDTAITFIQKCTDKTNYANQTSLNKSLSQTGTTNDNPCNIFDMASNVWEWTTETSSRISSATLSKAPCAYRGGLYGNSRYYTSYRGATLTGGLFLYGIKKQNGIFEKIPKLQNHPLTI
jgi:Tfp pilus assembly protein PilE